MHTPGPWTIEHDGHRQPGSRSKRPPAPTMVMVVAEKGGMPGIMISQGVVEPRDFYNAKLVAKAPELLEALKTCVSDLREANPKCVRIRAYKNLIQKIESDAL